MNKETENWEVEFMKRYTDGVYMNNLITGKSIINFISDLLKKRDEAINKTIKK